MNNRLLKLMKHRGLNRLMKWNGILARIKQEMKKLIPT